MSAFSIVFFFFQFFQIFHFIPPRLILSMHVLVFMVIERVKLSCQDDDGELWTKEDFFSQEHFLFLSS